MRINLHNEIKLINDLGLMELLTKGLSPPVGVSTLKRYYEHNKDNKNKRKKSFAEVVTPIKVVNQMVDCIDGEDSQSEKELELDETVLEITCGEAPFLTTRYEVATGEPIPIDKRTGVMDRKLRRIKDDWFNNALIAFQSSYGYDIQPNNVILARINLFMTFIENYSKHYGTMPTPSECRQIMEVISWNIWQMDGLKPDDKVTIMDWKNNQTVLWKEIGEH